MAHQGRIYYYTLTIKRAVLQRSKARTTKVEAAAGCTAVVAHCLSNRPMRPVRTNCSVKISLCPQPASLSQQTGLDSPPYQAGYTDHHFRKNDRCFRRSLGVSCIYELAGFAMANQERSLPCGRDDASRMRLDNMGGHWRLKRNYHDDDWLEGVTGLATRKT